MRAPAPSRASRPLYMEAHYAHNISHPSPAPFPSQPLLRSSAALLLRVTSSAREHPAPRRATKNNTAQHFHRIPSERTHLPKRQSTPLSPLAQIDLTSPSHFDLRYIRPNLPKPA